MDDDQNNIAHEEEANPPAGGEEKDNKKSKGSKKSDSARNASQSDAEREVKELKEKVEELDDQLKRAVADYRNLEKRFEEEKREIIRYANRDLLLNLIPAFDTLFLADKFTNDESVKLTVKHIQDILQRVGVERVKTNGVEFDPIVMEAVATETGEDGKVLEELRPGFTLNGKLIKPAQVKVGKEV